MAFLKEKNYLNPFSPFALFSIGTFFLITIDQLIKHKIRSDGGFYVCNSGISFNIPLNTAIFWLILGLFLLASFYYYKYLSSKDLFSPLFTLIFILIIGGALSNSLDRIFWGCVIDFISLKPFFFPFFNLADMAIFFGSCLFFLQLTLKKKSSCV